MCFGLEGVVPRFSHIEEIMSIIMFPGGRPSCEPSRLKINVEHYYQHNRHLHYYNSLLLLLGIGHRWCHYKCLAVVKKWKLQNLENLLGLPPQAPLSRPNYASGVVRCM